MELVEWWLILDPPCKSLVCAHMQEKLSEDVAHDIELAQVAGFSCRDNSFWALHVIYWLSDCSLRIFIGKFGSNDPLSFFPKEATTP